MIRPHDLSHVTIAHHRNGIAGEPFYVVTFTHEKRRMVATVFDADGAVAVLDIDQTAAGNIAFAGGNSWRGDQYGPALRSLIAAKECADFGHDWKPPYPNDGRTWHVCNRCGTYETVAA